MKNDTIYFESTADFRAWLKENHQKEDELWVGYYKKASKIPSMTWSESVDEALCFGWIDGLRKSVDELRYRIRFTPRRPNSVWSAVNVAKVEELTAAGLMEPAGLEAYSKLSANKSKIYSYEQRNQIDLNPKYQQELETHEQAWEAFQALTKKQRQMFIYWIMSAKREDTRLKRLRATIEKVVDGKKGPYL